MSSLRVNQIQGDTTESVEFTNGCDVSGDISNGVVINSGISTFTNLISDSINASGVCTASSFVGDGSSLTNLPGTTTAKAIGIVIVQN